MKKIIGIAIFLLFIASGAQKASAQRIALKSNLLEWCATSPNLGIEARLSRWFTFDMNISANPLPLTIANCRLNNIIVQPELRFWLNRPMARHFVGFAADAGTYHIRLRNNRYSGDIICAGFTYGYALVLSRHWNVEFEGGIGLAHVNGFKYRQFQARPAEPNQSKYFLAPVRLGVTFSYILK